LIDIKHLFPEISFQWNADTQTTKYIWLITHRSHGMLVFIDASDLPKSLEQISIRTPFLKTTPARTSCALYFNWDWNSRFTSQAWTERLYIKICGGKGCIYMRSATRSIRGQFIWCVQEFVVSFWRVPNWFLTNPAIKQNKWNISMHACSGKSQGL
jgi:hypothetical protein